MAQKSRLYTYPNGQPSDGQKLQLEFDNIYEGVSNIDSTQIQAGIITTNKIANGAVTEAKIATGAVTNAKLADGAVTDAKVSSTANIAQTKINNTTGWISTSLSTANDNATLAVNTANSAETKANSAVAVANSALVTANEALSAGTGAGVSETVIVNNLYASRGRIADLTVNHLLTGDFLSGDESLFYIDIIEDKIEFIQAYKNNSPMVQYTSTHGEPLYWESAAHEFMTTEETEWPVMVYQYDSNVVFCIKIEDIADSVGQLRIPIMEFGRGDGATPLSSKGRIYKNRKGMVVEYFKSNSGDRLAVTITDEGIEVPGNTGPKGLRNIAVGATPPANPQNNDLWIDTTGGVIP